LYFKNIGILFYWFLVKASV